MNKPTVSNPRVYDLARANNMPSGFIVKAYIAVASKPISASTRVDLVDQYVFWSIVVANAEKSLLSSREEILSTN
jgi:hypothetical protein